MNNSNKNVVTLTLDRAAGRRIISVIESLMTQSNGALGIMSSPTYLQSLKRDNEVPCYGYSYTWSQDKLTITLSKEVFELTCGFIEAHSEHTITFMQVCWNLYQVFKSALKAVKAACHPIEVRFDQEMVKIKNRYNEEHGIKEEKENDE